ncbi:MAG: VOC family protein [Gudongella sp.]|nr:VOC family protein [Gudongella sp.]
MQKIIPHLWFDKEAKEAAEFYAGLFEGSGIKGSVVIRDTPSGDTEMVSFSLAGVEFEAISAGPYFRFNPSINLLVSFDNQEELRRVWEAISDGGEERMALGEYPFSELYSWVEDRFGLNWQLLYDRGGKASQRIVPVLMFSNGVCGKTEEAIEFYTDVFKDSTVELISKYSEGEAPDKRAVVNFSEFHLNEFVISAMDNAMGADFTFNEAFSFQVLCRDQEEIDYYWDKLSADPQAEVCGWIKDKYGVSWQIIPYNMSQVMLDGNPEEMDRYTKAFLQMKKFDLEVLEKARLGK